MGSCQNENRCVYRHKDVYRSICNSWKANRLSQEGEKCRQRHPLEFSGPPPNLSEQMRRRSSCGQSPNQSPTTNQNCCPPTQNYNNKSFLEMGAAAAYGPGLVATNQRGSVGCCQEPAYPQLPQSQHHPLHHLTQPQSHPHHHGHYLPYPQSGNPSH